MLKPKSQFAYLALIFIAAPLWAQQFPPLNTLFTTPEERQLINSNRYKTDKPVLLPQAIESQQSEVGAVQQLVMETVEAQYRISGVSLNREGGGTAWINGQSYESGDQMEDGAKVRIRGTSVTIVTPDGKRHQGVSGETIEVVYQRTVDPQGS